MSGKGDLTNPRTWVPAPVLSAVHTGSNIDLAWTLAPDTSYNNFNGFNIHKKLDGGAFTLLTSVGVAVRAYVDAISGSGHTVIYYVESTWPDGTLVPSNHVSVTY